MTGYGSHLQCRDGRELLMELKTVNHRFLDIAFRLPKNLAFLEDSLRSQLTGSELCRGHIDIFVTYQNRREDARCVQLDLPLFRACAQACQQAAEAVPGSSLVSLSEMLSLCGALTVTPGEEDRDAVIVLAKEAMEGALAQLLTMRRREGDVLRRDLSAHLEKLMQCAEEMKTRAPEVPVTYRKRLEARLQEWNVQVADPGRMAQEVAVLADRCAVDEELARLNSHGTQFREGLQATREIGRKLDFLLQEMNREVNTIGSKASDEQVTRIVVEAKCTIEKLREQVQNVV